MLSFSYQTLKDATPFPSPLSKTQPPQNGFHRNEKKRIFNQTWEWTLHYQK